MTSKHDIQVGDHVRSFDFPTHGHPTWGRDLTGARAAYVLGEVTEILKCGDTDIRSGAVFHDCDRYVIRVTGRVFRGQMHEVPDPFIYPPVNGTPTYTTVTDGVERV